MQPYFTSKCSHNLTQEEYINSQVPETIHKISGDIDKWEQVGPK